LQLRFDENLPTEGKSLNFVLKINSIALRNVVRCRTSMLERFRVPSTNLAIVSSKFSTEKN